jgi:hypothetical protein
MESLLNMVNKPGCTEVIEHEQERESFPRAVRRSLRDFRPFLRSSRLLWFCWLLRRYVRNQCARLFVLLLIRGEKRGECARSVMEWCYSMIVSLLITRALCHMRGVS